MKIKLLFLFLFSVSLALAQEQDKPIKYTNPFEQAGIKGIKILTLSNGKYQEFHDLDSVVQIGTTLINVNSRKIVGFVKKDSANSMPDASVSSRWISPDPLAEEAYSLTPYRFGFNNPILFSDPDGLWERTSNGWRTSDQTEIGEFLQAWERAGKNAEVSDAKKGNEEGELFRVTGDSKHVGVFYGEERKEDDAKFRVNSKPHQDDIDSKMEEVPMVGNYYKSSSEFAQGNYGWGLFYGVMLAMDATTLGGASSGARIGLSSAASKSYTVYLTQRNYKMLAGMVDTPLPYFGITTNGINRYAIGTIQRNNYRALFPNLGKNTARGIEQALINLNNQGHYTPFYSTSIDNFVNSTSPLRVIMYNYRLRLGINYLNHNSPGWQTIFLK